MKKALTLLILSTGITYSQTNYWLSGDGYHISNGNRGSVLLGVRSPFASRLAIDVGNEAYALALTSDQGQYGNYVQIGVLGRNMDILQGRMLFNLHTSNSDLKYAGFDFRIADKSTFFISGEGNVGIGTLTKTPPIARLQIEGGPKWTVDGYNRSILLGTQDAIAFNGGGYKFGIGATGSSLNFFSTLQESNAQTQSILSLQPNSVTVEGDLIVKGNVISNGQMGQGQQTNDGGAYGSLLGAVGDSWTGVANGIVYTNGNVGIGVDTPSVKLDVAGSMRIRKSSSASGQQSSNSLTFQYQDNTNVDRDLTMIAFPSGSSTAIRVTDPRNTSLGGTLFSIDNSSIYFGSSTYATTRKISFIGAYYEFAGTSPLRIATVSSTDTKIYNVDKKLILSSNGTRNDLVINVGGKVGIGTLTPTASLDINGGLALSGQQIANYSSGTFDLGDIISGDGLTPTMRFFTNDGERMRIDGSGNVGIGTANPTYKLDVAGTINATQILVNGSPVSGGSGSWTQNASNIQFTTGNVGIGVAAGSERLTVDGTIRTRKVIVTQQGWADYVFDSSYKLMPLDELEQSIRKNRRLPGIPSARQVEDDGHDLGTMQAKLLEKIEELTLYVIELHQENKRQANQIDEINKQIKDK